MEEAYTALYQEFLRLQILCVKQAEMLQQLIETLRRQGVTPVVNGHFEDLYAELVQYRLEKFVHMENRAKAAYHQVHHTHLPTAQTHTPTAQTHTPTAQTHTPTAQTHTPTAQTHTPTAQTHTPTAQFHTPAAQTHPSALQTHLPVLYPAGDCVVSPLSGALNRLHLEPTLEKSEVEGLASVPGPCETEERSILDELRQVEQRWYNSQTSKQQQHQRRPWSSSFLTSEMLSEAGGMLMSRVTLHSRVCEFCHAVFPGHTTTRGEYLRHLTTHIS